jgi:hypothetical protein
MSKVLFDPLPSSPEVVLNNAPIYGFSSTGFFGAPMSILSILPPYPFFAPLALAESLSATEFIGVTTLDLLPIILAKAFPIFKKLLFFFLSA